MNSALLFFIGCIPARLFLAYLAYVCLNNKRYKDYKPLLLVITALIGLGLWTIYLKGWRKTGRETGGKEIWWNSLRPLHGSIYLLFTLLAFMGHQQAWMLLVLDAMIGIAVELNHIY
jgi:hypothetical protein